MVYRKESFPVQATACTENQGFPYPQRWGLEWAPECRLHGPPLESVHISLGHRAGPPVPVRSDMCLLWQASRPPRRSKFVREHRGVVAIPVALKALVGVVLALQAKILNELGIAGLDPFSRCPTMIPKEVAALVLDCPVYDAAKVALGLTQARGAWRLSTTGPDAGIR